MHSDSEHFTQYKGPVSVSKWSYGVTTTPVTLRRHKTNALVQAALCPWAIGRRVSDCGCPGLTATFEFLEQHSSRQISISVTKYAFRRIFRIRSRTFETIQQVCQSLLSEVKSSNTTDASVRSNNFWLMSYVSRPIAIIIKVVHRCILSFPGIGSCSICSVETVDSFWVIVR